MDFFIIHTIVYSILKYLAYVIIGFLQIQLHIIIIKHNHAVYYKPNSLYKFADLANCLCPIY